MHLPYRLFATLSTVALTGCVTAADLDRQLTERFGDVQASGDLAAEVERNPCPQESTAKTASLSMAPAGRRETAFPLDSALLEGNPSDLELGRKMIAQAGRERRVMGKGLDRMSRSFGIDLAQFADHIDALDEGGADLAEQALASPAIESIFADQSRISTLGLAEETTIRLDRVKWRELADKVARTTSSQGWTSAFARTLGAQAKARIAGAAVANDPDAWTELERKGLIAAYFIAYFRNGKIIELTLSDEGARARLKAEFRKRITDTETLAILDSNIDSLSGSLVSAICPSGASERCLTLGTLGEETFVTRAGKSIGFPGISATIDLFAEKKISANKIDEDAVIGDLVRVLVEGLGDVAARVPGAPNSTMCKVLEHYCDSRDPAILAKVNDAGDRTEAAVATATGIAIRGGWLFSLNNEAFAKWIQTGVSVTFRKGAEKVAWARLNTCPGTFVGDRYATVRLALKPDERSGRRNRSTF